MELYIKIGTMPLGRYVVRRRRTAPKVGDKITVLEEGRWVDIRIYRIQDYGYVLFFAER